MEAHLDTNSMWEYFVDKFDKGRLSGTFFKNLESIDSIYLNTMGASGWELVQIETLVSGTAQMVTDVFVYWKRPSTHQWDVFEVTHPTTQAMLRGRRCKHCGLMIESDHHEHQWGDPLPSEKFEGRLYQECGGCETARYIDVTEGD